MHINKIATLSFVFILLVFNSYRAGSQIKNDPVFYLNSTRVDLKKLYLNTLRLDSVSVDKQIGAVMLFTRERKFSSMNLAAIQKKYAKEIGPSDPVLFRINNRVIDDTTSVRIDDSYFIYVTAEKLDKTKYLSDSHKTLTIINIELATKEKVPQIMIRGIEGLPESF